MASHPPAACCYTGFRHEGTPSGQIKQFAGVESYIAYPKSGKTDKAILYITDVLGHVFENAQLIADQFAEQGYFVVMPDLFNGKPLTLGPRPEGFDIHKWRAQFGVEVTDPLIERSLKELRENYGAKQIGTVGYCFGAKWSIRYLKKGVTDAAFVAHPSFVDEDELRAIEGPLSIAAAETDAIFPEEKRHKSEQILKEIKARYQLTLYSGVEHGFSVRCDLSKPEQKYAKEQAFAQAVAWFDNVLGSPETKL